MIRSRNSNVTILNNSTTSSIDSIESIPQLNMFSYSSTAGTRSISSTNRFIRKIFFYLLLSGILFYFYLLIFPYNEQVVHIIRKRNRFNKGSLTVVLNTFDRFDMMEGNLFTIDISTLTLRLMFRVRLRLASSNIRHCI
jgi:hypothetical protein